MSDKKKEFSKIYDRYIEKIYRFIFLKVSSAEIAQDLCSEAFLKGWEKFNRDPVENPQALLYRIARNLVVDHYRQKGRTQIVPADDLPIADPRPSLESSIANSSDLDQIKVGLANLKDDYQNVIIWHYIDDLSIPEVAKLLERTEDATRVLLHRALEALRNGINEV